MVCDKFPIDAVCASPGLVSSSHGSRRSLWFSVVARTMAQVTSTTSRLRKTAAMANLLRVVLCVAPHDLAVVLALLSNSLQAILGRASARPHAARAVLSCGAHSELLRLSLWVHVATAHDLGVGYRTVRCG